MNNPPIPIDKTGWVFDQSKGFRAMPDSQLLYHAFQEYAECGGLVNNTTGAKNEIARREKGGKRGDL